MRISRYRSEHEEAVLTAIRQDPLWDLFTSLDAVDRYRTALRESLTYVCHSDNEFCGYVRAVLDPGFSIYVSELFVVPKWRNKKVGQLLLEWIGDSHSGVSVYALSDEDAYYEKKGYRRIGSVFQLR